MADNLPPLPNPITGRCTACRMVGASHCCDPLNCSGMEWLYSADQMRAYALAARQQIDGEHRILLGNLPWPHTGHATTPDYADAAIDAAMKDHP